MTRALLMAAALACAAAPAHTLTLTLGGVEIGRASCRERV